MTAPPPRQRPYQRQPNRSVPHLADRVVPRLKGKSLKAARKALTKAECKLGKVKGHKGESAKVRKQNPKPGKVLAPGAKVNVKLGG